MRPRRTVNSNCVFRLVGGTEDNDLFVHRDVANDGTNAPVLRSTWEPTAEERLAIFEGANIELTVWGEGTPPVNLAITDVVLGAPPRLAREGEADG